jgi:hypothetical protein
VPSGRGRGMRGNCGRGPGVEGQERGWGEGNERGRGEGMCGKRGAGEGVNSFMGGDQLRPYSLATNERYVPDLSLLRQAPLAPLRERGRG